eukprot:g1905.t1
MPTRLREPLTHTGQLLDVAASGSAVALLVGSGRGHERKGFYGYSLPALTIVGVMILCANAEHICSFIETTLRAVDPPERRWRPRADTLLTAGAVALNVAAVIVSAGTAGVVVGAIAALCGGARDAMGHDGTHARRLRAAVNATQKRLVRLAFSPLLLPACLVVVTLTICQWPARTSAGMLHLMTAFKVALCLVHVWYAPPAADPRAPAPPANPANPVNAFSWFQTTLTVGGWLAFLWTEFKLADRRAYTMGGVTTAAIATALAVTTPGQARRLRGVLFVFTLGVVVCMLFVPFEYANNAIKAWSFVKGLFGGQGWSFFFNGDLFQAIGDFFKSAAKTC